MMLAQSTKQDPAYVQAFRSTLLDVGQVVFCALRPSSGHPSNVEGWTRKGLTRVNRA